MLGQVLNNSVLVSISITIDAEMTAGVVHSDILAYHTSANLSLSFVFEILFVLGNLRGAAK